MAAKTPAQWKTLFENVPFHRENYYTGPLGPDYTPGGTCLRLWAPTAATAAVLASPVKLPTTARSEALNSCSSTAVAATGSANSGSLFRIDPFSMSILFS